MPFSIPDNWRWTTLGELVVNGTGLSYKKENLNEKSSSFVRVLRGGNIEDGTWFFKDDDVMIGSQFVDEKLKLKAGTFITPAVTSLDKIGKTGLIEENLPDVVVGGFVLMLTPFILNPILWDYMLYFFGSKTYKEYCKTITNKSGQAFYNLSRQKLMQCYVPIPPLEEQRRINAHITRLFQNLK